MTDYTDIATVVVAGQNTSVQVSDADREVRDSSIKVIDLAPGLATAAYSRVPSTIVHIGDSIDANMGGPGPYTTPGGTAQFLHSKGYWTWAHIFLGHRLTVLSNAGNPGDTTTGMLARFDAHVTALNPGWVSIKGGTNDAGAGTAASVTIANLAAMYAKAKAAGIRVIAVTSPPRIVTGGYTLAMHNELMKVNRWIRDSCALDPWMVLVDAGQAIASPNTAWQAVSGTLNADNVHPDPIGAIRLGKATANILNRHIPPVDLLSLGNGDPTNLLSNGAMVGTGSTVATGWSQIGTGTISYVDRTDDIAGQWMQVVVPDAGSVTLTANASVGASLAIGDRVDFVNEMIVDALEASPGASTQGVYTTIQSYAGGTFPNAGKYYDGYWDATMANSPIPLATPGVWRPPVATVQPASTLVQVVINLRGGGTYRLGRAVLRRVS